MKKGKIRTALSLATAIAMLAISMAFPSYATTTAHTLDDGHSTSDGNVTATFTIGDEELNALGYTATVSVPTEVALTLSAGKFTGTDYVGVSGIIGTGQTISVTIDSSAAGYRVIYGPSSFSKNLNGLTSEQFSETLSVTSWDADACYQNLQDKADGKAYSAWTTPGALSVSITGSTFIPRYKGGYSTVVPLKIKLNG